MCGMALLQHYGWDIRGIHKAVKYYMDRGIKPIVVTEHEEVRKSDGIPPEVRVCRYNACINSLAMSG